MSSNSNDSSDASPWSSQPQPHSQPVPIPNAGAGAAPAFASSFAAFYPNSNSEQPMNDTAPFPRRSQGISPSASGYSGPSQVPSQMSLNLAGGFPSSGASGSLMPAFSSSKLRRPSFLASNLQDNGDEDRLDSPSDRRDDSGDMSEDVDMDMMLNEDDTNKQPSASSSSSSQSQYSRIPGYLPAQVRARSLSQSTSMTNRSPPWPNSPPRSSQHFLARATSEQQQALQASATSASNAMFMIPTPYRNNGQRDAILVQNGPQAEGIQEDGEDDNEVDYDIGEQYRGDAISSSRPFNSMNPQQLRNDQFGYSRSRVHSTRPSSRSSAASQEPMSMAMEDSPQTSSLSSLQPSQQSSTNNNNDPNHNQNQLRSISMEKSVSTESNDPMSRIDTGLRPSRSSPSLSALGGEEERFSAQVPTTPPHSQSQAAPSLPFSQQPLRRSQSASHRLNGFSSFANIRATAFPSSTGSSGNGNGNGNGNELSVPHTAPLDGSFRVIRANSFSGHSSAVSRANSTLAPSSGSSSSNSASANAVMAMDQSMTAARGRREHMRTESGNREREHRNLSQSSGSDSNQPFSSSSSSMMQPRVVKRAVNHKKGSLMPKSKDHLRIISQLRLETGEFEVASEAALHRISQSTPAPPAFSTPRAGRTGSQQIGGSSNGGPGSAGALGTSPFAATQSPNSGQERSQYDTHTANRHHRPSSSGGNRPTLPMPTRNRFPEAAVEDEDEGDLDSSGSDDLDYNAGMASEAEAAPYASGNEMSGTGEDLEDAGSNAGDGVGGFQGSSTGARNAWMLRDPASNRRDRPGMDMDLSPSSALGWSANTASRPGKRKMNDNERFEPYNSAFKRRAVSPAASVSSVSLSPLLTNTNPRDLPLPIPSTLTSLGPAAQILSSSSSFSTYNPVSNLSQQQQQMLGSVPPSPVVGASTGSWFNPTARSRGSSPAPSMSSSAGATRRWHGPMTDEEKEKNKVDLGKMNLG